MTRSHGTSINLIPHSYLTSQIIRFTALTALLQSKLTTKFTHKLHGNQRYVVLFCGFEFCGFEFCVCVLCLLFCVMLFTIMIGTRRWLKSVFNSSRWRNYSNGQTNNYRRLLNQCTLELQVTLEFETCI